ncbi:MAG: ATP-binding protein, partial [Solirubrobacterales bacterium]
RVLVVNKSGKVVADSGNPGSVGSNYGSRPEVATALDGNSDQRERSSDTLDAEILATSDPVFRGESVIGAVRVTQSVEAVQSAVSRSLLGLGLLGALVLAFVLLIAAVIANQIARPIRRLEVTARQFATGGSEVEAEVTGSSEQRSLARSFNEMTSRVGRLLRSQRDFVANASHQLRTPLTGLRLRLEGLTEETSDPGTRAELEAGLSEVDRLARMVDELLILSRAGEIDVPGEDLDLGELARETYDRWLPAVGERSLVLGDWRDQDIGTVFCARADFERVLDALIENAVNYSPPESEIRIEAAPGTIRVLDDGEGLDPGEEEIVFERFARGKAGRQGVKGTGLGLAIARELIGQWGGSVTISSRRSGGVEATVKMPSRAEVTER